MRIHFAAYFVRILFLPPCQIIYQMLKNGKTTSALNLILTTLLSVALTEFFVSSWRTCDVRGNSMSTGKLSKINFPRNDAKQFRLICLQSYFNLNIQPVLSDIVSSHLSTRLFLEFCSKQQSNKKFWESQITIAHYYLRLNLQDESFGEYQLMATSLSPSFL